MIQSLDRALELLQVLSGPHKSYTLAELSTAVSLPPSTTHRLLQSLCERGYAIRDSRAHMYSLGPALIPLGIAASRSLDLRTAAAPVLQRLSATTREDSFLIMLSGYRGVVVSHEDGPRNLKIVEKLGQEVELHCGAIRKSILAGQSPEFIEGYLEYCRKIVCVHPIPEQAVLMAELDAIRREGVSITFGEYIPDAVGIGAPVMDAQGHVNAAVGIVLPLARAAGQQVQTGLKHFVKAAAAELSTSLGYAEGKY